ncbi:SIS domain-containing protein [Flavobacterium sp.]|uniref:SIS domain-containing protein n=1 Tax=Flavobacterium sp. TaxID=239 RepID=UPI0039E3FDE0
MGKPFKQELQRIQETYTWAANISLENFEGSLQALKNHHILVVGSGGSSSACSYLALHHNNRGLIADEITPLELQYRKPVINKNIAVVFISAGGRNTDILLAFETVLKLEPQKIISLCLKLNSPLKKKGENFSIAEIVEFDNPAGKDGFLATNSLIAYFTIISRIYGKTLSIKSLLPDKKFITDVSHFAGQLYSDFTIIVLYAGWSKPVALDLESKFSEAGLGNILIADYRNFGHGRHNWFDKKPYQSAVISLITPKETEIAERTLALLPASIPVLKVFSEYNGSDSSIDLLAKSFFIVESVGQVKKIDPGRPGVPDYGSKLYHLKYSKFYRDNSSLSEKVRLAISRKFGPISDYENNTAVPLFVDAYHAFIKKMNAANFKGILLDYDGTLCSSAERLTFPREAISEKLNYFLEHGIVVGVVTGRGQSVRNVLQNIINEKHWNKFIIGYYNGAQIGSLDNIEIPIAQNLDNLFDEIEQCLKNQPIISKFTNIELRNGQITIFINDKNVSQIIKSILIDYLKNRYGFQIQILESSHSVDIISSSTSKSSIIDYCKEHLQPQNMSQKFLCIGDMGKFPGNDYQLLSNEYSLSVDQVSNDPNSCWNLSSIGISGVESTIEYFDAIKIADKHFKLQL